VNSGRASVEVEPKADEPHGDSLERRDTDMGHSGTLSFFLRLIILFLLFILLFLGCSRTSWHSSSSSSSSQKEKSALTHITAHMGKINAIDWSYNSENELLTAGQDATVKVRTRHLLRPPPF
jgi:hypothetical protein